MSYRTDLRDRLDHEIAANRVARIVRDVFANKFVGKPLTARFETAVRERLLGDRWLVSFRRQFGAAELVVWDPTARNGYERRVSIRLGYDTPATGHVQGPMCFKQGLSLAEFDALNVCYLSAAEERIATACAYLSGPAPEQHEANLATARETVHRLRVALAASECCAYSPAGYTLDI